MQSGWPGPLVHREVALSNDYSNVMAVCSKKIQEGEFRVSRATAQMSCILKHIKVH
jgi:hypothetical protein